MLSLAEANAIPEAAREGLLDIDEKPWGYTVRQKTDRFDGESALEAAGRFLGLVLVLSAYGQWFLPTAFFAGDVVAAKSTLSFLLGGSGIAIYWLATRGLRGELQVDVKRRELRVARRNSRGQIRHQTQIRMRDIESAFLRRTKQADLPAHLMVRLRHGSAPVMLVSGMEPELLDLQQRIKRDVKPVSEKLEERMARNVTFLSSRLVS